MAFFTDPSSKLERAIQALIELQGKNVNPLSGTAAHCYIGHFSGIRELPSRSVIVPSFSPTVPYRPEGVAEVQLEHSFDSVDQTDTDFGTQSAAIDQFIGDTLDTLNLGGANDQQLIDLAAAITAAGRWLAQPDTTPEGIAIAKRNADMVNFRCDWVQFGSPMIQRGHLPSKTTVWVVYLNFRAFISHAAN